MVLSYFSSFFYLSSSSRYCVSRHKEALRDLTKPSYRQSLHTIKVFMPHVPLDYYDYVDSKDLLPPQLYITSPTHTSNSEASHRTLLSNDRRTIFVKNGVLYIGAFSAPAGPLSRPLVSLRCSSSGACCACQKYSQNGFIWVRFWAWSVRL